MCRYIVPTDIAESYCTDYEIEVNELTLPGIREACHQCHGKGTIDCWGGGGVNCEWMYEDPDFMEDYRSGVYDKMCPECYGKSFVIVINRRAVVKDCDKRLLDYIDDWYRQEAMHRAEVAAEQRMGC